MAFTYEYPHPAVATDIVVFTVREDVLSVLLIRRDIAPFKGKWALPGGFMRMEESLEECAVRELEEETGLGDIYLEQLATFSAPKRDPRERVVSTAYIALVPSENLKLEAGSDAADAHWFSVDEMPKLAFDHGDILEKARERLTAKLEYSTIGLQLLDEAFTLTEVQTLYETISGVPRDKRNFRKWLSSLDLMEETGEMRKAGAHRPAKLYRLKKKDEVVFVK